MASPLKEKKKAKKESLRKPPIKGKFLEEDRKLRIDRGESDMVVVGEISRPSGDTGETESRGEHMGDTRWDLFAAYLFAPLGSLVLWLMNKEDRAVFHCKQSAVLWLVSFVLLFVAVFVLYVSIFLNVLWLVSFVLLFVLIGLLVWLYTLYVGFKAAQGDDVNVPMITDMLKK